MLHSLRNSFALQVRVKPFEQGKSSSSADFRGNFTILFRAKIKKKISGVGGTEVDPPTTKNFEIFLMPFGLSVPIINKIYHRTKAEEGLKHQVPL